MRTTIKITFSVLIFLLLFEILMRLCLHSFYVDESALSNFRTLERSSRGAGIRIAMLGDSFTYGVKVADDETSSYLLQSILREYLHREDIFVDNFGIPGTSTIEHYFIFERLIEEEGYNVVVLNFFIDDFTPYYYFNTLLNEYKYCSDMMNNGERFISHLFRFRSFELLYIYMDIFRTYLEIDTPLTPVSFMVAKMRHADSLRYRCARERLSRLGSRIRDQKSIPIFLLLPSLTLYDRQNPYPEEIAGYETEAMLLAKNSGFIVIDAVVELRDRLDQRMIVKGDIHYNKDGYRLIAEMLSERLIELLRGER